MAKRKKKKNKQLPGGRKIRYFKGHSTPWVDIARTTEPYGEETLFNYYMRRIANDIKT